MERIHRVDQIVIDGISSQLLRAPSFLNGMLRRTTQVAATKHTHAAIMQAYAQGLSTSVKLSASASDGILLKITAIVLFTQCMSIVSFNEPVL